jgi:hypothetical protein
MAHFAELDKDNFVINVIVVNNSDTLDEHGNESEAVGIAFCKKLFGEHTKWVQTSYNNNFRGRYAGIGSVYNQRDNVFSEPKPYSSWTYNFQNQTWEAPVPKPEIPNGYICFWSDENKDWMLVIEQDQLNENHQN